MVLYGRAWTFVEVILCMSLHRWFELEEHTLVMDCDSIFLVASYIRFKLDVGWWTCIHRGGGSSSRNRYALVGVVAPQLHMHTHVHMCGVQIVTMLAQLQL